MKSNATRQWLRETHSVQFELLRHFLRRFFDSEMITSPEQTRSALIGGLALVLPWFQFLYGPLKEKYAYLSGLATPGPYRDALRADELWLITLVMSSIGLLTAVKWQVLFPDLRDYRVLGSLPLRPRQIFLAKLLALLMVATAAMAAITAFPSAAFPMLSKSHWQLGSSAGALTLATAAGSGFFLFTLVALQGVMLNVLRPRAFRAAAGYLQGLLVALMLGLLVLSFSVQPRVANALVQPPWSRWLPPVWFLGLCQSHSGNTDPAMQALAHRGSEALLIAVILALCTYAISYRRHRTLLMEGASRPSRTRRPHAFIGWLLRDPRQQGVAAFMLRTLARSAHHRMILMGYGGLAFAVILSGLIVFGSFGGNEKAIVSGFLFFHIVAILALLVGTRHLFSLPTELKANWLFQLTERESRGEWLEAVDRLVLFSAAVLWIAPLPMEIHFVGGRGIAEAVVTAMLGVVLYDWTFSSSDKLPFTCSYLPGKSAGWMVMLQFLVVAMLVPTAQGLLLLSLYRPWFYLVIVCIQAATWRRFHIARREGWPELRLRFEDVPDPAVHGLNLIR